MQGAECSSVCQFRPKLVAMASSLEESEKLAQIDNIHANTFYMVEKFTKIGPVDAEIPLLSLKKEIMEANIYSPVGKFAERAKLEKLSSIGDRGQPDRVTTLTRAGLRRCRWPRSRHATRLASLVCS